MAKEQELQTQPGALDDARVSSNRLNALRAAVLGANDGIVSVAAIILGVAGATDNRTAIFAAGMAGLVACALSMAMGEFVSVSSQRDTEEAYIAEEKLHLERHPEEELEDLAATFEAKGLSRKTARQVAAELTEKDDIRAHLDAEFNLSESDLMSPVAAALASLVSAAVGGLVPVLAVVLAPASLRLAVTFVAVLLALAVTGYLAAAVGHAPRRRAAVRVIVGGALAMLATYGIGHLFGGIIG